MKKSIYSGEDLQESGEVGIVDVTLAIGISITQFVEGLEGKIGKG